MLGWHLQDVAIARRWQFTGPDLALRPSYWRYTCSQSALEFLDTVCIQIAATAQGVLDLVYQQITATFSFVSFFAVTEIWRRPVCERNFLVGEVHNCYLNDTLTVIYDRPLKYFLRRVREHIGHHPRETKLLQLLLAVDVVEKWISWRATRTLDTPLDAGTAAIRRQFTRWKADYNLKSGHTLESVDALSSGSSADRRR